MGHDGRRGWHLERVEVEDTASGTTFFFPAARWVPAGAMSRALQLKGYTTDPASMPVRYRLEADVEGSKGAPPPPGSLRLVLCGTRGESPVRHLDASWTAPGRALAAWFEAENVGQLERLRIGLAPAAEGGQQERAGCTRRPWQAGPCSNDHRTKRTPVRPALRVWLYLRSAH